MSINFVNMASGETLYSYPMTNYFKYETVVESDLQRRKEVIGQLLNFSLLVHFFIGCKVTTVPLEEL